MKSPTPTPTLSTFLEEFEQFADISAAIPRLREFVLRLAVDGRLVERRPGEGSGESLRMQLIEFKSAHPLEGRSGQSKDPGTVGPDSERDLPENWARTTIGEVLWVIRGASPRPKGDPLYFSDARTRYHWVKISDIRKHGRDGLLMDTDEFLTEAGMRKSVLLPKGTLVLTNSATIGVPIVLGIEGCCIHDGYLAFPNFPEALLSQKYFVYLLRTLKEHAEASARGLAQLNLNTDLVRSFPFGLPPLAEQKRIVAKVDELMALCDRLEAQLQERDTRQGALARAALARFADAPTPANLEFLFHDSFTITPADLRKTILTLAVQGHLVPQDPDDEPADQLVTRIAQQRRAKYPKVYEAVSTDEGPYELPYSWTWVRLGNISLTSDAGWSPQCLPEPRSGTNWGVLKVSAVSWGAFRPDENKALPTGMDARADCEVRSGDFLLSRANTEELVARSVVVDQTPPRLMMSDKIVRFTFPDEIEKAYINLANLSDPSRGYYARLASGTSSSMKNVGREVMCNLPIALPPLAEQRRIVAKMDQLMALVDQWESQIAAARTSAVHLLSAFVAELTQNDRPSVISKGSNP
jgi:type I restriction enzyme S subunit